MFNNEIYNTLVEYIEQNKTINNIDYSKSIDYLFEVLSDIKKDYEDLKENEEC